MKRKKLRSREVKVGFDYLLRDEGFTMKIKIKIKKKLDEMSSAGAVVGYAGPFGSPEDVDAFNKNGAKEQRLKGDKMVEMMSTSTGKDVVRNFSVEDEQAVFDGQKERAKLQGNRAITEGDKDRTTNSFIESELLKHGIKGLEGNEKRKYLGGGVYGGVWEATRADDEYPGAIKVVSADEEDIDREIRNYTRISRAREKSSLIEKHFPETFDAWKAKNEDGKTFGFIFMEKLEPVHPDAKQHLPDVAYWRAAKGKPSKFAKSLGQDISKRAEIYFKSDKFLNVLDSSLEEMNKDVDFNLDFAKKRLNLETISILDRQAASEEAEEIIKAKLDKAEKLSNDKNLTKSLKKLRFLLKDFEESKFSQLTLLQLFNVFAEYGEDRASKDSNLLINLDDEIKGILDYVMNSTRTGTFTHSHYDRRRKREPKQPEKQEGVEAGILDLYNKTGLYARDLHWNNFLSRPSGELVVVDLGLFKMGRELKKMKESRKYRIKLLTNN